MHNRNVYGRLYGWMESWIMQDWFMDSQSLTVASWTNSNVAGVRMQWVWSKKNNAHVQVMQIHAAFAEIAFCLVWTHARNCFFCSIVISFFRMLCSLATGIMKLPYTWKYHRPADLSLEANWPSTDKFRASSILPKSAWDWPGWNAN